jgi:hypothetical protein
VIKGPKRIIGAARRLGLLGLIATILAPLLGFLAPPASATPLLQPQTRVAAIEHPAGQIVGPHSSVLAGEGRERAPTYDGSATGSSVAAEGGAAAESAVSAPPTVVIGAMEDLGADAIGPNEETLASRLPGDTGSRLGNWLNNRDVLQTAMDEGQPIRDATVDEDGNLLNEDTRRFITMERDYLRSSSWPYDPASNLWMPPG